MSSGAVSNPCASPPPHFRPVRGGSRSGDVGFDPRHRYDERNTALGAPKGESMESRTRSHAKRQGVLESVMLDSLPLTEFLRQRVYRHDNQEAIARKLHDRFGGNRKHWRRLVTRLLTGEFPTVKRMTVDRVTCALGTHPELLYPYDWTAGVVYRRESRGNR